MQLSIIIVNYNVKYFLEQCLRSVIKAVENIDAEIFVVDNHSTDGSDQFFINRFPVVKFIWKKENVGFAKANNEALKLATGERILFLNPDTVVPEDCFERCLIIFSAQQNIGALGVKMIDGSGCYLPESKRGFPSIFNSFCKMSGISRLFPHSKLLAGYYLGHLSKNEINEVDILSGAFMMANKNVLNKVGSFDEAFFMYAEDIDLSFRIQKAGFKNFYFPGTTIIHFKGESTQKESVQYIQNFYGAMQLFVKKHYGKVIGTLYILLIKIVTKIKSVLTAVKKLFSEPGNFIFNDKAYVISNPKSFREIEKSIQQHFAQVARLDSIAAVTTKHSTVILCESQYSFSEMISIMKEFKTGYHFFIHAEETYSIVGSLDKNASGNFIALN